MTKPQTHNQSTEGDRLRERDRLAQLVALLGRHGLRGLAARLGLQGARDERLEAARPEAMVAVLREVGPVGVKFGQMLAMRSDLLGPEWVRALSTLQDRVPALPFDDIEPVVADAIGGPLESYFASFDRMPLAAASIAQVHAATLHDGRSVIVKVRRPGIERIVDADLRLLRRLARAAERRIPEVARLKPDALLRYFAESLDREMDLSAEARSSDSIGGFLAPLGVRTASFEWDITGKRVNVQERLLGIAATDLDAARAAGLDLQSAGRSYAQAVLRMIIFNGQFHADPHPGNVILLKDGSLGLIDFGAVGTLLPRRRDELVRLALAIAADDVTDVTDILMLWAGDPDVERPRLELELGQLIDGFKNVVLDQIDLTQTFQQVFALLRDFQLALPPDLALVLRTLLTAEGFVRRIDPSFDIASELAPIARELATERTSLVRLRKEARKLAAALGRAALSTPEIIAQLEKVARTGSIPVSINAKDLRALERIGRGERRSRPPIIPAALFMCAAILARDMPLLAVIIASIAAAMLLWEIVMN